jgi:hypothetical protein
MFCYCIVDSHGEAFQKRSDSVLEAAVSEPPTQVPLPVIGNADGWPIRVKLSKEIIDA